MYVLYIALYITVSILLGFKTFESASKSRNSVKTTVII